MESRRVLVLQRLVRRAALIALLVGTMGSGGGSCCPGPPPEVKIPPPLDAVWCDFSAVPCWTGDRDPTTLKQISCTEVQCTTTAGAPCNTVAPGSNGTGPNDFQTCDPATCTLDEHIKAQSGMGVKQCFDHTKGVTASQACAQLCNPNPSLPSGKTKLPPLDDPPQANLRSRCVAVADLVNPGNHPPYDSISEGTVPDYVVGGCMDPGQLLGHPSGTNRVALGGAGTFSSPGNGVSPTTVAIDNGFFNIDAPNTDCTPLQTTCPAAVNQVEIQFADFSPVVSGSPHLTQGLFLSLDQPFMTPSGRFFPAGGGLPASFSFELPPGIVFDSIGTVDGTRQGLIATSDQFTNGTINLATGQVVFDFDLVEIVNGEAVELTGTATTASVLDVAPTVTAPATLSVDATTACSVNVTLAPTASSLLNLPVSLFYSTDGNLLGTGATKTVSLAIGPHTAVIKGVDTLGAQDVVTEAITVNDKTPPVFDTTPSSQTVHVCGNGSSTVTVTVPTAHNFCTQAAATVTGTVTLFNGVTVSVPVLNGTVSLPPGVGTIHWVAQNANGVTTPLDQTVTVAGPATFFGSRGIAIADRGIVNGSVFSGAGGVATVGNDAAINGNLISLSPVQLRDRTTVTFIDTNAGLTPGSNDHIGGTSTVTPVLPAFPTINQQFTGSTAISVPPDTSRSLAPGQYGAVTVFSRAKLVLSAGTYVFTSLDLEPQASLVTPSSSSESVRIFVRDSVIYRGRTTIASGAIAPLFLGYTGSNAITIENVFTGTIVAPSASLNLQSLNGAGVYTGDFFARQVDLSPANTTNSNPFTCH